MTRTDDEGTDADADTGAGAGAIRTFVAEVVAVEDVHAALRRIVVGGAGLATFEPVGPDSFVYVLLPPPGRATLSVDESFSWDLYERMPEPDRPVGAYYTVRRWDPGRREIEMLFVLHAEGHGASWARRAEIGDPLALWGPRTAFAPPQGTDGYLLVADETGLPAVAAIIEALPADVPVVVIGEVPDHDSRQELPERSSVTVTWCHRDGAAAGTTTLLRDAAQATTLPGARPYVWGGGESRSMTDVRTQMRRERGLARPQVSLVAYWRHRDHEPAATDDDE